MNHLLRKIKSRGGSKKPKVTPAVLNPPKIGNFQFGASFSIAETIDLISDGPIEGLVDPEGNKLPPNHLSRGVYLNGTAVSVASKDLDPSVPIEDALNIRVDDDTFSEAFEDEDAAEYYSARAKKRFRWVMIHPLVKGMPAYRTHDPITRSDITTVVSTNGGGYFKMTSQSHGVYEGDPNEGKYYVRTRKGSGKKPHSGYVLLSASNFTDSAMVYCLSTTNSIS